ncbi:hypothetical protein BJX63DRAFT_437900 [Aspergillus granulosus]|uniref:Uncharacterized protein n=1 Tax=Aspergillus granulosus TaxID=176169 RepID=A0ABR4GV36_9EURO
MASSEHRLSSSTPARALPNGYLRITQSSQSVTSAPRIMDYERAPSEEVANTPQPSLIEFLKCAWDEGVLPTYSKLFAFLGALKFPHGLRDPEDLFDMYDDGAPGRFVKLYESSHFRLGDDEGILFDQTILKASFIEDYNDTMIITSHKWGWMPLEVILDSYLQMIDEEKVQTISKDQANLLDRDVRYRVVEPWIIHQYTKTDLERTTTAFKPLVEVIDSRIKHKDTRTFSHRHHLPTKFLKATSNCKFRFRYIAPGIRFPTVPKFMDQPITDFLPHNHLGQFPGNCPLRIFQIDVEQQLVARDRGLGLCNIATGFYIHPVVQNCPLFWSNGCRLLLPCGIGAYGWAQQSNGEPLGVSSYLDDDPEPRDDHGNLYQGGMTNGITNFHLVQIDKVLNNWADRVEKGDWEVPEDGVAGVGKFKEADTEEHWQKHWIPLSW